MTENIKQTQPMLFKGLRVLGKASILVLQAIAAFASDDSSKPRLTAGKAQQLYEDGMISGTKFAEHIHKD